MEQDTTMQEEPILITPDMLAPLPPIDTRIAFEKGMSYLPLFVLSVIIINLAIYLGEIATGALQSSASIIAAGALKRELVLRGEYWRLISAAFLHASWGHLLGNSAFLYVLGMANEHAFGIRKAAMIYGISAITGSLLSISASPGPSIGASGAVFGLMGSLAVLFFRNRSSFYLRDRNIGIFVGAIAIFQIILGFLTPYIDNFCHIGGFLGGTAAALWLRPALLDGDKQPTIGLKSKRLALASVAVFCGLTFLSAGYAKTLTAAVYREFGMPQRVIEASSHSIKTNTVNDYAYFLRGEAYFRQKQYPKAISDLELYLVRHPDNFESWALIAHAYSKQEQYQQAIGAYTQALSIRPNVNLYNSRGYAYILKRDYKLARADFLQIQKIDKKYAPSYGNLGLLDAINGNYAKAVPLLQTSLKLDKSLVEVKKLIEALEYEQKGQKQDAIAAYAAFVKSTKNRSEWLAEFRFAEKRIRILTR
jgi:rhomboid protease GluP